MPVSEEEKEAVLPRSADNILTFYRGERSLPMLQRMLSLRMEGLWLDAFLASAECSDTDRIRFASL